MGSKRYLVLCRAGDASLHRTWLGGGEASFDLAVSSFGDGELDEAGLVLSRREKGSKWLGIVNFLTEQEDLVRQYDYIWLPDDDLLADAPTLSEMFDIAATLQLDLAQPALAHGSYWTHPITLRHLHFVVRFTNCVEIMAPIFSIHFLYDRILPKYADAMRQALSGWGLDSVWPRETQLGRVAILDKTPVKHTRPVGGPVYKLNQSAGTTPQDELAGVCATYLVEREMGISQLSFGGIDSAQRFISFSDRRREMHDFLRLLRISITQAPVDEIIIYDYLARHHQFYTGQRWPERGQAIRAVLETHYDRWCSRFHGGPGREVHRL